MKGYSSFIKWIFYTVISLTGHALTMGQQNNTLFFMHSIPEANYVNPAVQIDCGVFIGLPLVSSFHANFANSGFVLNKAITLYTDGTVARKDNLRVGNFPSLKYFLSEIHSVLFAAGVKKGNNYYNFTITEKNNTHLGYTADLVSFIYRGSEEFEGQAVALKGTTAMLNHLREYAFGMSRIFNENLTVGVKVKLLFGKFNFTTGNSSFGVFIEEGTQDILFDLDGGFNSSLPWALQSQGFSAYRFEETYPATWLSRMMNRNNPGVALDIGFIYRYNNLWTFSGSLLDAGLIWYRSNLSNYGLQGNERYQGPFGQGRITGDYLWNVFDDWNFNMDESLSADPYVFALDPRLYLGASRQLNEKYKVNFLLYNRLLPGKLQTGATLSVTTDPEKTWKGSASWSYMNNSLFNLGLGVMYGKNPVQLYAVTDNIFGFILPLSTKNVNLRIGINLILGCRDKPDRLNVNDDGCSWMKSERTRRLRKEKLGK